MGESVGRTSGASTAWRVEAEKSIYLYAGSSRAEYSLFLEFTRELYSVYGSIVHSIAESTGIQGRVPSVAV